MAKISQFIFNPFGENTYIIYDETTRHAAIIDPGMFDANEEKVISDFVERNKLEITDLIYTHIHIDHSFGNDFIKNKYGVKASANEADAPLGLSRSEQAAFFHLRLQLTPLTVDRNLKEGDIITLGPDTTLKVIEVPGHSPGSIALYCPEINTVFTGDALFHGSVGRTDIYGGNHEQLINSIKTKLLTLPEDTIVLPGHSEHTTIGDEARYNSFLK